MCSRYIKHRFGLLTITNSLFLMDEKCVSKKNLVFHHKIKLVRQPTTSFHVIFLSPTCQTSRQLNIS